MKNGRQLPIGFRNLGFYRGIKYLMLLMLINACSPEIVVRTIKKPSTSNYHAAQVEPTIAINPIKPNEIIAGTVLNDYYYSKNGGKTWKSRSLTSPHGVYGDPVAVVDQEGVFYYFHLSNPVNGLKLDRIVCQRTFSLDDSMKTIGFTTVNEKMHDKHSVAIDPNTGVIHMAWTQFDKYESKAMGDSTTIIYSSSTDKGKTWRTPIRISKLAGNCLDDSGTIEGVSLCIGLNSEIFVAYCLNESIYLNSSLDGGFHWFGHGELSVAQQPGGWSFSIPGIYRMNGFPSLQLDRSNAAYRGRLYLSWSDQKNGSSDTDVWMKYSDDWGRTWSNQIRVNNDNSSKHQFMSCLRVDPKTGTLVALFYDRRQHNNELTDVYLAYSKNGGQNFENVRITKQPFLPDPKKFIGDYLALDIRDNRVQAMWPEIHDGSIRLRHARIDLTNK
jgi:hypothetical protein